MAPETGITRRAEAASTTAENAAVSDVGLDALPEVPVFPRPLRLVLAQTVSPDRLALLRQFAEGGRTLVRYEFLRRCIIFVNDPKAVGEVLLERTVDYRKGPALAIYSRPLLGNGLLTSEGEFHRRQRGLVAPAFAHRRLVGYADVMAGAAVRACDRWSDGQTVDIAHEMTRLTLGIVGKTLFGADGIDDEADEVGRAMTLALRFFNDMIRAPIRLPFPWLPPWRRSTRAALARLDATIYRLVDERRAAGVDAGDLLSMLLLARDTEDAEARGMTDRQVRDELMTLFLAGHETTANALAWTWYLLAQHPTIYARLQAEVDDAMAGEADRPPAYADLDRMPYTLQVFKEAMRLYPPAFAIARQALVPTQVAGHRVPRGAIVLISPYMLHRRPEAFPDPERFDPDRWTPESERSRPRFSYLPFGGGPRVCVGAAFALMEGHLCLATIARRVTFALAQPDLAIQPEPLITLRPRGPIPLRVRWRVAPVGTIERSASVSVAEK